MKGSSLRLVYMSSSYYKSRLICMHRSEWCGFINRYFNLMFKAFPALGQFSGKSIICYYESSGSFWLLSAAFWLFTKLVAFFSIHFFFSLAYSEAFVYSTLLRSLFIHTFLSHILWLTRSLNIAQPVYRPMLRVNALKLFKYYRLKDVSSNTSQRTWSMK
jgi:hypothetical protein